jgi:hypothetical protein
MRLLVLITLLFLVGTDGLWRFGRGRRRANRAKRRLAHSNRTLSNATLSNGTLSNGTLPYTLSDRMINDNLFLKNVANYSH